MTSSTVPDTIASLGAAFRSGAVSPTVAVEACLQQIATCCGDPAGT